MLTKINIESHVMSGFLLWFISSKTIDDIGYLKKDMSKILFGKRDIKSIENNFEMLYNINTKSALSLKFRNFWSVARYSCKTKI